MNLKNKSAIVTGGSRGIGRGIALRLAREGVKVAIVARTSEEVFATVEMIKKNGGEAIGLIGDVSNWNDVQKIVEETVRKFSTVDILINNAGIQKPIGLFQNVDIKEWIRNFEVNLFGAAMFCKAVLPLMIEKRNGKIINLSGGGATYPRPYFSAYSVSKTAIVRFTEILAEEVKDYNIHVNAIAPCAINTRMLEEVLEAGELAGKKELEEAITRAVKGGSPLEIVVELALFLASEESDGITGKLISAPWDPWKNEAFIEKLKVDKDIAVLRRIDDKTFFKK
ncbi:3-oxoacyl-[acyl-carrier protein] reductase [Candidatus Kryptonium thompsonii]|nr:3-oxoacyl-[acyl-carrier protein] reductase [Candidatus Kryptonium thompsoni]